ncbi:hypothetical protein CspeluHIS016_0401720 [Cutaneotrichosporon spelunceum]|uniref:Uncharacterized protein n=1 Tax=Cutaneotrichosporon spelunceum TaxID=1672016 RepID=A0AAD3YCN8_9TREE|nr:hypothetical protein CspeluHIS016_0401720 [Cutaneotrichosporon spelunceum]
MWDKPQQAMYGAVQNMGQWAGQQVGGSQNQNQQSSLQGQHGQHGQHAQHGQQQSWAQNQQSWGPNLNQNQQSWGSNLSQNQNQQWEQQNNQWQQPSHGQHHGQQHGQQHHGKQHSGHHEKPHHQGKPHRPSPKPEFDGWDQFEYKEEDWWDNSIGKKVASVPLQDGCIMAGFKGRSDRLVNAPTGYDVRKHYLNEPLEPPLISRSPFIPIAMLEHLMRNKKDTAISVKYIHGDKISDMEGVAHTFVTPIVFARMHGDYAYKGSHIVLPYAGRAREVVVSAAIHPDFEDTNGMMALARLEHYPIQGEDWREWNKNIASGKEKYNDHTRASYDARVRSHLIFHLIKRLPSLSEVQPLSVSQAIHHVENGGSTKGMAVHLPKGVVSLELLFRSYVEALSNELGALEAVCLQYVYTSDPPTIFARECDATLLNRLQAAALEYLVGLNPQQIKNMRIFAFNDYADPNATYYFQKALNATNVVVMTKSALFPKEQGGYYWPPSKGKGCLLVLHNNSDAFGQNIETEGPGGSMDGAIGCNSSVASSLQRDRWDLLTQVFERGARLRVW